MTAKLSNVLYKLGTCIHRMKIHRVMNFHSVHTDSMFQSSPK